MYTSVMTCPRRERLDFNKKWQVSAGSAAADSLYCAMFFAKMHVGVDARVFYDAAAQLLIAISTTRVFELRVPRNGYLVTVVAGGKETRIQHPTDVIPLVPKAEI